MHPSSVFVYFPAKIVGYPRFDQGVRRGQGKVPVIVIQLLKVENKSVVFSLFHMLYKSIHRS